eukprot:s1269_g20.t1
MVCLPALRLLGAVTPDTGLTDGACHRKTSAAWTSIWEKKGAEKSRKPGRKVRLEQAKMQSVMPSPSFGQMAKARTKEQERARQRINELLSGDRSLHFSDPVGPAKDVGPTTRPRPTRASQCGKHSLSKASAAHGVYGARKRQVMELGT